MLHKSLLHLVSSLAPNIKIQLIPNLCECQLELSLLCIVTPSFPSTQPDKRAKKTELMVLMADWKKVASQKGDVPLFSWHSWHVMMTRPTDSNKSEADLVIAESEDVGGEFHDDESAQSILAARATKGGNITRVKYKVRPYFSFVYEHQLTSSHITDPHPWTLSKHPLWTLSNSGEDKGRRRKSTLSTTFLFLRDLEKLPTIRSGDDNSRIACTSGLVPFQILFGTNAIMGTKVSEIWNMVYPPLVLEKDDPAWDAICGVVSNLMIVHNPLESEIWSQAEDALLNWCSSAGKDAIKIIVKVFKENKVSNEEVSEVAEHYLHKFWFIYGNPSCWYRNSMSKNIAGLYHPTHNPHGLHWIPLDSTGLHWTPLDSTGLHCCTQHKIGLHWTGLDCQLLLTQNWTPLLYSIQNWTPLDCQLLSTL